MDPNQKKIIQDKNAILAMELYYHFCANVYVQAFNDVRPNLPYNVANFDYKGKLDSLEKPILYLEYKNFIYRSMSGRVTPEIFMKSFSVVTSVSDLINIIDLFLMNVYKVDSWKEKIVNMCKDIKLKTLAETLCEVYDRNFNYIDYYCKYYNDKCGYWDFLNCWFFFWDHISYHFLKSKCCSRRDAFNNNIVEIGKRQSEKRTMQKLNILKERIDEVSSKLDDTESMYWSITEMIKEENSRNYGLVKPFLYNNWILLKNYASFQKNYYLRKACIKKIKEFILQQESYKPAFSRFEIGPELKERLGNHFLTIEKKERKQRVNLKKLQDLFKLHIYEFNEENVVAVKELRFNNRCFRLTISLNSVKLSLIYSDNGMTKESNPLFLADCGSNAYKLLRDSVIVDIKHVGPHSLDYIVLINGKYYNRELIQCNEFGKTKSDIDKERYTYNYDNLDRDAYNDWDSIK